MSEDFATLHEVLRRSTAAMLGCNIENLTPIQALRLDLACSLRLEIDRNASAQARGEPADLRALTAACSALEQLLHPAEGPLQSKERGEAKAKLAALIEAAVAAGPAGDPLAPTPEQRIAELEAEIAALRAGRTSEAAPQPGGPSTTSPAAPSAPAAEVVPLRPRPPRELTGPEVAARIEAEMTRPRNEPWRQQYSTPFGIHSIPKGW
jgi:hypothetical protein